MRIGLSSIIGDGFGTGSFSFGELLGNIPPVGYAYTLYTQEYPIVQGGSFFYFPDTINDIPNQTCDVDVWHDGAGGYYTNWSTATNVQFKAYGGVFHTGIQTQTPVDVTGSLVYYDSEFRNAQFIHDGTGSYTATGVFVYYPANTIIDATGVLDTPITTEVPSGSGVFYPNGKYDTYLWDGAGAGVPTSNYGSYYSNGTYIVDISQMQEVPTLSGNFYNNGKYTRYNWNGTGGVTTLTNQGSFFANGTYITLDLNLSEVPTTSGNYYHNGETTTYNWDGTGGYVAVGGGSPYPYGTYIMNDGTYDYYWDGTGSYYSFV